MKNFKRFVLFLVLSAVFAVANAQKQISEGSVTYTLTYELNADQLQYADLLPKEVTYYMRGDSSAGIAHQGDAIVKGVSVFKAGYHSMIVDIPKMSKKIVVVFTPAEVAEEQAAIPQLTGAKGIQKDIISGYNCVQYNLTDAKSGTSYEIWLTEDVAMPPNILSRPVSNFGGLPVRFVTFNNGIKINAEIKEIKEEKVPMGFFTAAKDYEPMSYADLKAMSGG